MKPFSTALIMLAGWVSVNLNTAVLKAFSSQLFWGFIWAVSRLDPGNNLLREIEFG